MPAYEVALRNRIENPNLSTFTVNCEYLVTPGTAVARNEFYKDYLGGIQLVGGVWRYVWPKKDAAFPYLYVSDVKMAAIEEDYLLDRDESEVEFKNGVIMNVTYEPRVIDETDLLKRERNFTVRNLTLPNKFMKWKSTKTSAGKDIPLANEGLAAVKTIPQEDYAVTLYFVRRPPKKAISQLNGRVNEKTFTIGDDVFYKEQLRFEGASTSQRVTNFGEKYWEVTYRFSICPVYDKIVELDELPEDAEEEQDFVGWNRLYNPRVGKWERMVEEGDASRGAYLYDRQVPDQKIRGRYVEGFNLLFTDGAK